MKKSLIHKCSKERRKCLLSSLLLREGVMGEAQWLACGSSRLPPRAVVFGWLVLRKRILRMDNLRGRGMVVVNVCAMCLSEEETMGHLFLNCEVAHLLWRSVMDCFGCSWVFPNCIVESFQAGRSPVRLHKGKEMWGLTYLAVIWTIWKERSLRCFEGKELQ